MSGAAEVTLSGNLIADPELRFTASGVAVSSFAVAVNSRVKVGDVWKDGTATIFRCSAWRGVGENLAASLCKGDPVTVTGTIEARPYETKEGDKRMSWEVTASAVSVPLRFVTVKVAKVVRSSVPDDASGLVPV